MPATWGVVVGACAARVIVVSSRSGAGAGAGGGRTLGVAELGCGLLDGLDDVHVAGTPAEVARDPLAHLLVGRLRVLLQEPCGLHDHPRGAEPALEAMTVPEGLLERVERAALLHALDGTDLRAVRLDGEHRARLRAGAVDVDRAGAAVARVAAGVGAGEAELVAEEMHEQEARLDVRLVNGAVDGDRDVLRHAVLTR